MANQENMSEYLKNCKKYKKFNYKEIEPKMIEYLHNTDLKILKEIKKVFEKNSIKYCAVGGTLLGAYTRNDFIPWDEDIDIAVFEDDYESVIKLLMTNLPEWLAVQCKYTDPNYYHEWIKVSDKNSIVYPNNGLYKEQGVWVDIYKLRKMKKSQVAYNIAVDHKLYLERRLAIGNIDSDEFNKRMKENNIENRIKYEREKMNNIFENDEDVYLIGTASKPFVELKYVFPLKEYLFSGLVITSFNNAEAYLKNHYGKDYNVLPNEKDRNIAINKVVIKDNKNQ